MEDDRCSRVNHRGTKIDLAENLGGEAESMSLYKRGASLPVGGRSWGLSSKDKEDAETSDKIPEMVWGCCQDASHFNNCRSWGHLGQEQGVRGPEDAPVWLNS